MTDREIADAIARRNTILALRDGGMTLAAIGERFGLSRERVRQIIAKEPRPAGRPWPAKDQRGDEG